MKNSYKKVQGIKKKWDDARRADTEKAEIYLDSSLSLSSGND